jgi:hypothetical protein
MRLFDLPLQLSCSTNNAANEKLLTCLADNHTIKKTFYESSAPCLDTVWLTAEHLTSLLLVAYPCIFPHISKHRSTLGENHDKLFRM